ncbi:MAG: hypothetical protein AAFU03_10220, partial [Bacteroidota bacterium]
MYSKEKAMKNELHKPSKPTQPSPKRTKPSEKTSTPEEQRLPKTWNIFIFLPTGSSGKPPRLPKGKAWLEIVLLI